MANVKKGVTYPAVSTPRPTIESILTGLFAGETIAQGDAVYVKTSDGKLWKATGAAATEPAEAIGLASNPASADDALSVFLFGSGLMVGYYPTDQSDVAITAGALLYVGTGGFLADAVTTGGDIAVAWVVGDGRICLQTPPFAHAPAAAT